MDEIILSYHDSLLRKSDLHFLEPGNWLNDKIISFMFQYYQEELFKDYSSKFSFLDADIVQLIKFSNGDEVKAILSSLNLEEKDFVFVPVNNNSETSVAGGTHWSLVVYDRDKQEFLHFDSLTGKINTEDASCVCKSLSNILKARKLEPKNMKTPIQSNGAVCGLYVIKITQLFCEAVIAGHTMNLNVLMPSNIKQERFNIKDLILKKSNK